MSRRTKQPAESKELDPHVWSLYNAARNGAEAASVAVRDLHQTLLRDALIFASGEANLDAVGALLDAGARVSCEASDSNAPLSAALRCHQRVDFDELMPILSRLLDAGAPIDFEPTQCGTALACAVSADRFEEAQWLVARGSNLQQIDREGRSLLQLAAMGDADVELLSWLLASGLDASVRDARGNTLLHNAVAHRELDERIRLLAQSGVDVHALNSRGETALVVAAAVPYSRSDQGDAALCLLELGADPNVVAADGIVALHELMSSGNHADRLVDQLVQRGADVNARTVRGNTPLHLLVSQTQHSASRDRLVRRLCELGADIHCLNGAGESAFGVAVCKNEPGYWETLAGLGADINQQIGGRGTALHVLVGRKQRVQVQRLLKLGADATRCDEFGSSPIWYASADNKCFVVRDLVAHGGDCNAANAFGETPLGVAIRGNQLAAIRTLVKRGADVNAVNARSGETPLTYAVRLGDDAVIEALVELGANVNQANRGGETPLMLALHSERTISRLLALGADLHAVNARGETALGLAWRHCVDEAAVELIEHGATNRGAVHVQLGAAVAAAAADDATDQFSALLRTPYLCDWFLWLLELPDLSALVRVNRVAYRAVSAHWRDERRRRFLLADTTLRLMCPSRARQRAMLRRMMEVSGGRWIVVLHGEGNELFDCVLQAYDLSGHCGSPAATLSESVAENILGLDVRGGCSCPCARRGEHSATEPLFVCAAARGDPVVACLDAKNEASDADGWRLAVCGKCGAQRPLCNGPEFSICIACAQTRPLMWIRWCAYANVGYNGGNVYDVLRFFGTEAGDDVDELLHNIKLDAGEDEDDSFEECVEIVRSGDENANLSRRVLSVMTRERAAAARATGRAILAAPRESLGMISLPYHSADGYVGYEFVALLGDSAEAAAIVDDVARAIKADAAKVAEAKNRKRKARTQRTKEEDEDEDDETTVSRDQADADSEQQE